MNVIKQRLFYSKLIILFFGLLYLLGDVFSYQINISEIPFERVILLLWFFLVMIILSIIPQYRFKGSSNVSKQIPSKIKIFLPVFLVLMCYAITTNEIISDFVSFFNHRNRENEFFNSMTNVILDLLVKSVIIFIFYYWNNLTKRQKITIFILFIFIILFDVAIIGARRTTVFLLIAFIGSVFLTYSKLKKKLMLMLISFMGIFFILFGGIRQMILLNKEIDDFSIVDYVSESNEFELVTKATDGYVKYADRNGFFYGESLMKWPLFFIPRSIWNDKPVSLGRKTGIFTNFFGEAYLNFGILSPFFIFLFFFIILIFINTNKINSLILFSFLPEVFRTSFSEYIFTLIILFYFIWILKKISLSHKNKIYDN